MPRCLAAKEPLHVAGRGPLGLLPRGLDAFPWFSLPASPLGLDEPAPLLGGGGGLGGGGIS